MIEALSKDEQRLVDARVLELGELMQAEAEVAEILEERAVRTRGHRRSACPVPSSGASSLPGDRRRGHPCSSTMSPSAN
jgi:hypothetical protein